MKAATSIFWKLPVVLFFMNSLSNDKQAEILSILCLPLDIWMPFLLLIILTWWIEVIHLICNTGFFLSFWMNLPHLKFLINAITVTLVLVLDCEVSRFTSYGRPFSVKLSLFCLNYFVHSFLPKALTIPNLSIFTSAAVVLCGGCILSLRSLS